MRDYRKLFAILPEACEEVEVARQGCLESRNKVIEGTENRLVEGSIAEERYEDDDQKDAISEKGECTQSAPLSLRSRHSAGRSDQQPRLGTRRRRPLPKTLPPPRDGRLPSGCHASPPEAARLGRTSRRLWDTVFGNDTRSAG